MQLVALARRGAEELDRRSEGDNDVERTRAFLHHLPPQGARRVLTGLETAAGQKEAGFLENAGNAACVVKDDRICSRSQPVGVSGLRGPKASNACHVGVPSPNESAN